MARKAIAVMLLLVIAAWAEMAVAPMLAILTGHMHGEHALATTEFSQHAAHHAASAQKGAQHSCCPPIRRAEAEGVLELVTGNSGCQDSHRCCFQQGPQSVPEPVSEARQLGPQPSLTPLTGATQTANGSYPIDVENETASPPYPQVFGMTLRV